MTLECIGAVCFGIVMGWVTYRTLRRKQGTGLSDIATVLGAIGGATVAGLFPKEDGSFSCYAIGLAVGFFGYLLVSWVAPAKIALWMGDDPSDGSNLPRAPGR
jgi:uncharacterized membrane protein YeaQ/YmgE (transglycosylase-associated protein family)